ncbi:MAG: hypothetical protein WAT70_05250 [Rhizobiaceae bacterium]
MFRITADNVTAWPGNCLSGSTVSVAMTSSGVLSEAGTSAGAAIISDPRVAAATKEYE